LNTFIESKALNSYSYLKSVENLDFVPNLSFLTPYNIQDKSIIKKGDAPRLADNISLVKVYSNLCGLIALNSKSLSQIDVFYEAISKVTEISPPSYD
jgi:hypothetical protein